MSAFSKADYDYINLGVCIKNQADRLGIEHDGIPLEGVVVRIAERALAVVAEEPEWESSKERELTASLAHIVDRDAELEADRDRLHKAITEALAAPVRIPERSPLVAWPDYKDEVQSILRAALDKGEKR